MSQADEIMRRLNPNALAGRDESDVLCFIEDVRDPDGRIYRMEYQSTDDGNHAFAFCRYNPWGGVNGGETDYFRSHVRTDGFICLGPGIHVGNLADSPFTLEVAVRRSRYWCTAFSVLKETGSFPNP